MASTSRCSFLPRPFTRSSRGANCPNPRLQIPPPCSLQRFRCVRCPPGGCLPEGVSTTHKSELEPLHNEELFRKNLCKVHFSFQIRSTPADIHLFHQVSPPYCPADAAFPAPRTPVTLHGFPYSRLTHLPHSRSPALHIARINLDL